MIIGTLTLLSLLFFGSYQGAFFELENVEKLIKHHVEDDVRKDKALEYSKAYFDFVKESRKEGEKLKKELKKLSENRETSREDLEKVLDAVNGIDIQLQQHWAVSITNVKSNITEKEFEAILKDGVEDLNEKSQEKADMTRQKFFTGAKSSIDKHVENSDTKQKSIESLETYEAKVNRLYSLQDRINFADSPILRKYDASVGDYDPLFNLVNEQKRAVLEAYFDFHFDLVKLLTDDEWKELNKDFQKLL